MRYEQHIAFNSIVLFARCSSSFNAISYDKSFSEYFVFPLSLTFHHCYISSERTFTLLAIDNIDK
jgi:hypothetical protein